MDREEVEHRDRVLRSFFEGRDWDCVGEFLLKRELVLRSRDLLPAFPFLVDDEWEVVPGMSNMGRGDLVFTDGEGRFAVVEVKHIDLESAGATARTRRKNLRNKVREQAAQYARQLFHRHGPGVTVEAYSFTNEHPFPLPIANGLFSSASVESE